MPMEFAFVDLNTGMRFRGITCTGLQVCSVSKDELEVESMGRDEFMDKINIRTNSRTSPVEPSSEFYDVCGETMSTSKSTSTSSEPFTQISEL